MTLFNKIKSNQILMPYLLMIMGMVLFLLSNGNWIVPVFTWIAFVFLIRAFRTFKKWYGRFLFFVLIVVTQSLKFKGMIPAPSMVYYIIMLTGGIIILLTFVADRWSSKRINGFAATLIFPIISILFEYLAASSNPIAGSWGSLAHTQDNLSLMQITSITGMWGLTFLITWLGSALNWFWDKRNEIAKIKKSAACFIIIYFSVILYGQVRNRFFSSNSNTVRIASIVHNESLSDSTNLLQDIKKLSAFRGFASQTQTKILGLSLKAADEGAKIIFLHEGSLWVLKENKKELVIKASKLARDRNIYFGLSLVVMPTDFPTTKAENKIVWIDPKGNIIWDYDKAYPTMTEALNPGEKKIKTFDTPYGKIASVICFDMDFPTFINQAGKKNVDIMLVPANDWRDVTPYHANMAKLRAIENGFSIVRATGQGLSLAVDYKGKVLNQLNYYQTKENIMISDIPIKGVHTIYAKFGDWFVWVCIIGLLFIIGREYLRKKKKDNTF